MIGAFHNATRTTRALTGLTLGFFLWLNVHPAVAAIKNEVENPTPAHVEPGRDDEQARLTDALESELHALRAKLKPTRDRIIKTKRLDASGKEILDITIIGTPAEDTVKQRQAQLRELAAAFEDQEQETLEQFKRDKAHLDKHKLPAVIHERHAKALADFKIKAKDVQDELDQLSKTTTVLALHDRSQILLDKIKTWRPRHHKLDPNNLPFRTPDEKVREPLTNPEALQKMLKGEPVAGEPILLAHRKAEITATELALIEADEHPYALDRGKVEVAGPATPVPAPGPEFLAETEDVQITDEIRAKANELNNHPVEIYNWVYNNIEYVPTYGSIQGSQLTLDKKAGNAFDTSSLLVALLRAANIPARYVYGTVDIPLDKAMNWVGGVTVGDAAQQLLGQGGIPHVGLTQGGRFIAIRMEHVWVEAWVDFYPSRGAKNLAPDTWAPMDAAYKQYIYTEGLPLEDQVPFDAQTFLDQAQQGAIVDEQAGFVQNLNQTNIQSQLTTYQQRLQTFIDQQNPDATVGDVLGSKNIEQRSRTELAASLPNRLIARSSAFAAIPDNRQSKFRYSLYASERDLSFEAPIWTFQTETVKLAQKKVTLAFVPTTDADRQTIESYLPKPHADGSPIRPEEFPRSLPAYNISVTPELRVEGQTVKRGGSFTLGTEMVGEGGFTNMGLQGFDLTTDPHVAGQTSALGLSLNGISGSQLEALKNRLESTKAKLEASDLAGLTGEHLSGDLLTATIWSYFAAVESFGKIAQRQAKTVDTPGLSFGFFHSEAAPLTRYGFVTSVRFPGLLMDVGHVRRLAYAKNNRQQEWVNYNRLRGQHLSAMEHAIPELIFDVPNDDIATEGVSAVKLITVAASHGQKIYTITQANQSQIANLRPSLSVMDEIRNAIASGKEVTVHEAPINYAGFRGAGYTIIDPQTGAGGYLIEGGANGGSLTASGQLLAIGLGIVLFGSLGFAVSVLLAGGVGLLLLIPLAITALTLAFLTETSPLDAATFRLIITAIVAAFLAPAAAEALLIGALLAYIGALLYTYTRESE